MPRRKTAEANAAAPAENVPKRAVATKSAVATHKHKNSKPVNANVEATAPVESPRAPSHEEIALLAYSYWESRGYQEGSPEEDWLRAERELVRIPRNL